MDNDDLLISNKFTNNFHENSGYGMTEELRRFALKDKVKRTQIELNTETEQEDVEKLLDQDLLKTNPIFTADGKLKDLDSTRITTEVRTLININSIQREIYDYTVVVERDKYTNLYTRIEIGVDGISQQQIINADILNNELYTIIQETPTTNGIPDIQRPYYLRSDGNIGKLEYKYPNPNKYIIPLPYQFSNVKSIRLTGVEIPNSFDCINQYNNLILIDIRNNDDEESPIDDTKSPFPFIMFQITPGNYTISDLITTLQKHANDAVSFYTSPSIENFFNITYNSNNGAILIELNNLHFDNNQTPLYTFHWKFCYLDSNSSNLPITENTNLWYMLGFPHPYKLDQYGNDVYSTYFTNVVDFGVNPLIPTAFFNDGGYPQSKELLSISIPYRYPILISYNYIYLQLSANGSAELESIIDIQNPQRTKFTSNYLFAKVIFDINSPLGQISTKFESMPFIFKDTLPVLSELEIKWVDPAGIPVDFHFTNHSFTLEIVEYIDSLDSNNYNTRRGTIDKTSYPDIIRYGGH